MTKKERDREVECGSGNVFRDLGLPNAERRLEMAKSLSLLRRLLKARPDEANALFERHGIDSAKRTAIEKGGLSHQFLDELRPLIRELGCNIERPS